MTLGEFIATTRRDRGISLRQLSKLTGIQNSHLSEFETGKRPNPPWRNVVKIARALNLKLDRIAKYDAMTENEKKCCFMRDCSPAEVSQAREEFDAMPRSEKCRDCPLEASMEWTE